MREYELVFIISPQIAEDDVEGVVKKVSQTVASNGGEVIEVNPWGRKRLAYPINRFREGNYVAAKLRLKPSAAAGLERNLKLNEDVIRYLLVKIGE